VIRGEQHFNHLCSVFLDYYYRLRRHQGKDNELLVAKRGRRKRCLPKRFLSLKFAVSGSSKACSALLPQSRLTIALGRGAVPRIALRTPSPVFAH
jgi:hypothetical protein